LPENENRGVVQIDGRMVERLHADMARQTVAIADAIAKRKTDQPAKADKEKVSSP
jgi:citrate lyase subunit beta/citryl-CoA lyase